MKRTVRALGQRVAQRRRELHLTQEELAERAQVNVKTVQGVEQGRTEPELRTMRRVASALDTTLDGLVNLAKAQRPNPAPPVDATIRAIEADLRHCSPRVLKHVAAIVRALARR